ncbi:hypothetical protein IWQ57_000708 [Coemansia nantahalensis]|uniref:Uncharacterized protein n=2 Tax=Coemansia TaxID=4863 RepID=A0ACC1KW54_9FUNG|nr:hypothetical protein IWQ57_000708 [Coemansia nantahalensis]KAJ2796088.1 hypothetical protein H4R21_004852 [Coemansia helicoidea]
MFQRVRSNSITPLDGQRHFATASSIAAEEQLNKRLKSEIDQLLSAFGEIIQTSRIYSSSDDGSRHGGAKRSAYAADDGDGSDDSDSSDAPAGGARSGVDLPKDKYVAAQEAYGAQTRAATMVRSVENLLSMVADIKRAHLVNDTSAMTAMADRRRRVLEERVQTTRAEIEALNSSLDAAVRELEALCYNSC